MNLNIVLKTLFIICLIPAAIGSLFIANIKLQKKGLKEINKIDIEIAKLISENKKLKETAVSIVQKNIQVHNNEISIHNIVSNAKNLVKELEYIKNKQIINLAAIEYLMDLKQQFYEHYFFIDIIIQKINNYTK